MLKTVYDTKNDKSLTCMA